MFSVSAWKDSLSSDIVVLMTADEKLANGHDVFPGKQFFSETKKNVYVFCYAFSHLVNGFHNLSHDVKSKRLINMWTKHTA